LAHYFHDLHLAVMLGPSGHEALRAHRVPAERYVGWAAWSDISALFMTERQFPQA
jgi:hypothetical protein